MTCMVQWIQMRLVLMSRRETRTLKWWIMQQKSTKIKLEIFNGTFVNGRDFKRRTERDEVVERAEKWTAEKNEWRKGRGGADEERRCGEREHRHLYLKLRLWVRPRDNWEETWSYSPLLPSPGNTHTSAHYCTPTAWTQRDQVQHIICLITVRSQVFKKTF